MFGDLLVLQKRAQSAAKPAKLSRWGQNLDLAKMAKQAQ